VSLKQMDIEEEIQRKASGFYKPHKKSVLDCQALYKDGKRGPRVKQAFKEETDINRIMKKYETTGVLPDMIKSNPQYGDFSNVTDYQQAMNTVILAREQFDGLSAKIRKRFNNSPEAFLAFVEDPENHQEMVELGLAQKLPGASAPVSGATGAGGTGNASGSPAGAPEGAPQAGAPADEAGEQTS
jgi:phage internal scaffolding protein